MTVRFGKPSDFALLYSGVTVKYREPICAAKNGARCTCSRMRSRREKIACVSFFVEFIWTEGFLRRREQHSAESSLSLFAKLKRNFNFIPYRVACQRRAATHWNTRTKHRHLIFCAIPFTSTPHRSEMQKRLRYADVDELHNVIGAQVSECDTV